MNPERKNLYQLCWHLGGSQSDIANLKGEDVDWIDHTVSYARRKTGAAVLVHLGEEALILFKDLPAEGPLFPVSGERPRRRSATEFGQRCRQLGIKGVTLHSYPLTLGPNVPKLRNAGTGLQWKTWARTARPVHRAYSKRALVKVPSLEEYERRAKELPAAQAA